MEQGVGHHLPPTDVVAALPGLVQHGRGRSDDHVGTLDRGPQVLVVADDVHGQDGSGSPDRRRPAEAPQAVGVDGDVDLVPAVQLAQFGGEQRVLPVGTDRVPQLFVVAGKRDAHRSHPQHIVVRSIDRGGGDDEAAVAELAQAVARAAVARSIPAGAFAV